MRQTFDHIDSLLALKATDDPILTCIQFFFWQQSLADEWFDPDAPLRENFNDVFIGEDVILALVLVELVLGVEIPEELCENHDLTPRQLAIEIGKLKRMTPEEYAEASKEKVGALQEAENLRELKEAREKARRSALNN